jgi:hypothetical protein
MELVKEEGGRGVLAEIQRKTLATLFEQVLL